MNFNKQLLIQIMKDKKIRQYQLAKLINKDVKTVSLKFNGKLDWSLKEVQIICTALEIKDVKPIFFPTLCD